MGYRPWLHRFACLLVVATFVLVASGGNVTSRDAGLAVPDGFWVYDHFLWFFPVDHWVGNIFHEHIHRLKGSAIGLLTITLALWLWIAQSQRRRLRWFGVGLVALVIAQGVMGALRVDFARWQPALETPFRILHGVTGQIFLCATVVAAAALSRMWMIRAAKRAKPQAAGRTVRVLSLVMLGVLLVQLILGAAMRHSGSGLAIPDFPGSYGTLLPPLTQAGIDRAIAGLPYDQFTHDYTVTQVGVHFAHRVWAIAVVAVIGWFLAALMHYNAQHPALKRPALIMVALLLAQLGLGAAVIWTERQHAIATSHQAVGALILAIATLLALRVRLVDAGPVPQTHSTETMPMPGAGRLKGAGA
jgi:cytochrome c oxidase assembly protein subunit 15